MPSHTPEERKKRAKERREERLRREREESPLAKLGDVLAPGGPRQPTPSFTPPPRPTPTVKEREVIPEKETTGSAIFRNQETGQPSGLRQPDGGVILGDRRDIQGLIQNAISKGKTVQEAEQIAAQAEKLGVSQKALDILNQFQGQPLPPEVLAGLEPFEIDFLQSVGVATTAGLATAGGALAGAAIGGVLGAGVGAAPGAAIGGTIVGGLVGSQAFQKVTGNVQTQVADWIAATQPALEQGRTNLGRFITMTNAGTNPVEMTTLFYEEIEKLQKDHEILKLNTNKFKNYVGKDGHGQLVRYEIFFERTVPAFEQQLRSAIINPNPNINLISSSDL